MTCDDLDRLITPFIDGECTNEAGTEIVAHLRRCESCRIRVEAESTAKHLLHAHAAVARTMNVPLPWRPRVFRLGQPVLPAHSTLLLLLVTVLGTGLAVFWLRPAPVLAVGVIGDSFCEHEHRFTTRFNVNERECTLGCVKRGAEFVLVGETQVYRIRNQHLSELATFANRRVKVEGRWNGDRIVVARLRADDAGGESPPDQVK